MLELAPAVGFWVVGEARVLVAQMEKLTMKIEQRASEETDAAFQTGFRTAIQMIAAGLSVPAED